MKTFKWMAVTVAIGVLATLAYAEKSETKDAKRTGTQSATQAATTCPAATGSQFVDADGDGVCDNKKSDSKCGKGLGKCGAKGAFVDANGDGICDNKTGAKPCRKGRKACDGSGQGGQCNFVDANGDGVCDRFVDANGDGVCDTQASCSQDGARGGQCKRSGQCKR